MVGAPAGTGKFRCLISGTATACCCCIAVGCSFSFRASSAKLTTACALNPIFVPVLVCACATAIQLLSRKIIVNKYVLLIFSLCHKFRSAPWQACNDVKHRHMADLLGR